MAKLNKTFLIGNLCRDPDLRYAPSGLAIVGFSIAINRDWTTKEGEKKEEVCYVEISMFGKRAEAINEYFKKGDPIFIEGRLKFEQWEKDGQKRSTLKVIAEDFQFIGGKTKRDEGSSFPEGAAPNDINEEEIPF